MIYLRDEGSQAENPIYLKIAAFPSSTSLYVTNLSQGVHISLRNILDAPHSNEPDHEGETPRGIR